MGFNFGGMAGGAASGASMGSMLGPWGTAIGAVGGGIMGALGGKKKGAQMMAPGVLYAEEDDWAKGSRKENYDYISDMMSNIQAGIDPMEARRKKQLEWQLGGIRRDFFGTPGDRNQSIVGMGQQQMAHFGANPKAMLAQKNKTQNRMQYQMDDVRQRIADAGTQYMEKASMWAPEMSNKLRTGRKVVGTYGAQMFPGDTSKMDMQGMMAGLGKIGGAFKGFSQGNVAGSGWFGSKFGGKTQSEILGTNTAQYR